MEYKVYDVSKWNGNIDWIKVKATNPYGVILRIGYRGYGNGAIVKDAKFDEYVAHCISFDIPYGVYFFSQAITYEEGKEEARWTLQQIENLSVQPRLPIFIDTEASTSIGDGRADKISNYNRTWAIIGFCEYIEAHNYFVGIYASTSWFNSKLIDSDLTSFAHWVADYRGSCGYTKPKIAWQYSSSETVDGIPSRVDASIFYSDAISIIKSKSMNMPNSSLGKPIETIRPFSYDSARMKIKNKSLAETTKIVEELSRLEIHCDVGDEWLITNEASTGDQITMIKMCMEMDVEIAELLEEEIIEEKEEKEEEIIQPTENDEAKSLVLKFIKWLMKLFDIGE